MTSWMDNQPLSDVQVAIQSQTLQTALEENTSKLSDQALESFLTNAPIPRLYLKESSATTLTNAVETVIAFTQSSRVFDPYAMLPSDLTSTIRIPRDGFYAFDTNFVWLPPTGGGTYQHYVCIRAVNSGLYGAGNIIKIGGGDTTLIGAATISHYEELSMVKPFLAGDTFRVHGFQNSSVNENTASAEDYSTTLAGVWVAPFKQFKTGGN